MALSSEFAGRPKPYRALTSVDRANIEHLITTSGLDATTIANILTVSPTAVKRIATETGITIRGRAPLPPSEQHVTSMAVTVETGRLRTEERLTTRQIGERYGMTASAVQQRLRTIGISGRLPPAPPDHTEVDAALDRWWTHEPNSRAVATRTGIPAHVIEQRRRERGLITIRAPHTPPDHEPLRSQIRAALQQLESTHAKVTTANYDRWRASELEAGRHWPSRTTIQRVAYPRWSWQAICHDANLTNTPPPRRGGAAAIPAPAIHDELAAFITRCNEQGLDPTMVRFTAWNRTRPTRVGISTIRYRYGSWTAAIAAVAN